MSFLTWLSVAKELWELLQSLIKSAEVEGVEGESKHAAVMEALKQIYDIVGGLPGVKGTPAWGVVSLVATKLIPAIVGLFNKVGVFKKIVPLVVLFSVVGWGQSVEWYVQVCQKRFGSGNVFVGCRFVPFVETVKQQVKTTVLLEQDFKAGGWKLPIGDIKPTNIVHVQRGLQMMQRVGLNQTQQCGSGGCYHANEREIIISPVEESEEGIFQSVVVVWLE